MQVSNDLDFYKTISYIYALLDDLLDQSSNYRIELRRHVKGIADVIIRIPPQKNKHTLDKAVLRLSALEGICSVKYIKGKFTIRFADEVIASIIQRKKPFSYQLATTAFPTQLNFSNKKVLVDFCDPNTNKALHIGHLRNLAIGKSMVELLSWAGAEVSTQSVVCDIGRNIAEALSGILLYSGEYSKQTSLKYDHYVGNMYQQYVSKNPVIVSGGNEADKPIEREIDLHNDKADKLLSAWVNEDNNIRQIWEETILSVLDAQSDTLSALDINFDNIVRESDSIKQCSKFLTRISSLENIKKEDNVFLLETGRKEYSICPLTRTDNFPTEHLRALILWDQLRKQNFDVFFHVMGKEWEVSTQIRVETLEELESNNFTKKYYMIPHEMLQFKGSLMKSSTGNVVLIDDLIHSVKKHFRSTPIDLDRIKTAVFVSVCLPLLSEPKDKRLEIDKLDFMDHDKNHWIKMSKMAFTKEIDFDSSYITTDFRRYLILQIPELLRSCLRSINERDPHHFIKQLKGLYLFISKNNLDENDKKLLSIIFSHAFEVIHNGSEYATT